MGSHSFEQKDFDDHIMELVQMSGGSPHADLIKEMIITALRLVEEPASRLDIKILNAALRELRYAFKLFSRADSCHSEVPPEPSRPPNRTPLYHSRDSWGHPIISQDPVQAGKSSATFKTD